MSVAVKILNQALSDDFGFKCLLWVFSGRRGIHCWVCDDSARRLNNEERTAIINYLAVHVGNEMAGGLANLQRPLHPALERACEVLYDDFDEIMMKGQEILNDKKQEAKILSCIMDKGNKEQVIDNWANTDDPSEKWQMLIKIIKANPEGQKAKDEKVHTKRKGIEELTLPRILITYLYPRLDINVSKEINHLLKSPFCVHPKTGKICVPFNPETVEQFDTNNVPTLTSVLNEYNKILKEDPQAKDK